MFWLILSLIFIECAISCNNWIAKPNAILSYRPLPIGICYDENNSDGSTIRSLSYECEANPDNSSMKIAAQYRYETGDCTGDKAATGLTYDCNDATQDLCECTIGGDSSDASSDCDIYTSTTYQTIITTTGGIGYYCDETDYRIDRYVTGICVGLAYSSYLHGCNGYEYNSIRFTNTDCSYTSTSTFEPTDELSTCVEEQCADNSSPSVTGNDTTSDGNGVNLYIALLLYVIGVFVAAI